MPAEAQLVESRSHSAALRRSLSHRMKSLTDAEDAAQDAYVRLLELEAGGQEINNRGAFLNRVARNISIDHLRRRQRAERIFVSADESDSVHWQWLNAAEARKNPEEQLALTQTVNVVTGVIGQLPSKCSRAYMLSCLGNHSRSEIAEEIGVSVSMIEKYVRRARDHLFSTIAPSQIFAD